MRIGSTREITKYPWGTSLQIIFCGGGIMTKAIPGGYNWNQAINQLDQSHAVLRRSLSELMASTTPERSARIHAQASLALVTGMDALNQIRHTAPLAERK
jgi:hypothetical protein